MQVKTTTKYDSTNIRIAFYFLNASNKYGQGWSKIGNLVHYWWDYKGAQPLWKTTQRFLKKFNSEYDPEILLLGYTTKRNENPCPHENLYVKTRS